MTNRKWILVFCAFFALLVSSGCVYRASISQGNLVQEEDLAQLEVGMTRKQVRFLLGTPMIDDPFHRDRWDYVYYQRIGRDDRYQIRALVSQWIADPEVHAVITTGGTGLTGRDGTPEAVGPLLDKVIEGFGEMFRVLSYDLVGTSTMQSRAIAGVANGTFVFCLPGSSGACKDGWSKLIVHQLDYRTRPCNLVELIPRLLET